MRLQLIVFFMGVVPAYLSEQNNTNETDQLPQLNQMERQEQTTLDNSLNPNDLCPNNQVLLDTLNILKKNIIEDVNWTLSPDKFKQVLDTTIKYLNAGQRNDLNTDITNAPVLKSVLENFNHRTKKEALRSYQQFGISPESLKGRITLQYELPNTNHPDCQILFKAILNAINVAYLKMNNFCLESGKCYIQNEYIPPSLNLPRPLPGNIFSQTQNLPPSNQLPNRSNIIDFLGSYPQNGDVKTLLQNYRPNTEKAIKENIWSISTDNNIASAPIQATLMNPIQDNINSGGINPDTLDILQSFRPKYNDLIKNHGLPLPQGAPQLDSNSVQQNGNLWTLLQHIKPNAPFDSKENVPHYETIGSNVNNGDGNSGWNDLTRDQGVMEVLTVLNRPTGYISESGPQSSISQPNVVFNSGKMPTLLNNNTAEVPQLNNVTPQFIFNPVDNFGVMDKDLSEFTAKVPWDNNLRLNANIQNPPYNRNMAIFQGVNLPYKPIEQKFDAIGNIQNGGFAINSPMKNQNGMYYPTTGENNFYQFRQYYPDASYNSNMKLPNTILHKQAPYSQYSNWYQNQKVPNNVQYPTLANIPSYSSLGPNQFQFYQQRPLTSDNIFANQQQDHISKQLSDLYRLAVTNGAKLNIAPNKNGIVELTFTLQRPQSLVYKPLYYVKYRLPYQTYIYNVKKLMQRKPILRNDPDKLYQELLHIANISELSQDLKYLEKEEISKLVATNGAFIEAKVLDETSDKNEVIKDDVNSVIHLASNLNPEEMLNATKKALNSVEDVLKTSVSKVVPVVKDTSKEIPVKDLNTRSINYPIHSKIGGGFVSPANVNGKFTDIQPYNIRNK